MLAEAAASGLPLICTTACGAGVDLVRPVFNGLLTGPGDVEGLARAMRWMHEHEDRSWPRWAARPAAARVVFGRSVGGTLAQLHDRLVGHAGPGPMNAGIPVQPAAAPPVRRRAARAVPRRQIERRRRAGRAASSRRSQELGGCCRGSFRTTASLVAEGSAPRAIRIVAGRRGAPGADAPHPAESPRRRSSAARGPPAELHDARPDRPARRCGSA